MSRILAIDYGNRRVGLAVTDPLQIIATPLDTVDRKLVLDYLVNYIKSEAVECFVVGQPFRADGSLSDVESNILTFIHELESKFVGIPIHRIDESFTSKQAKEVLIQSGLKKKKRRNKSLLDSTSATIILQDYLRTI